MTKPSSARAALFTALGLGLAAQAHDHAQSGIAAGRALAHDLYKGNCLACHAIPRDPNARTSTDIGPPLIDMKARFPDRARLRAQIWDPTRANPNTIMPPFGKHKILSEEEIGNILDYLYAN